MSALQDILDRWESQDKQRAKDLGHEVVLAWATTLFRSGCTCGWRSEVCATEAAAVNRGWLHIFDVLPVEDDDA